MLRTHSLLPLMATLKSFGFYCNKEHGLIGPDTVVRSCGIRKQKVT